MTLKFGMHHRVLEYCQVCSNDDPGLTLTYFTARSNLVPYAFVWEKVKTMDFSETIVVFDLKLATDDRSDKKPWGLYAPLPLDYIHILNHEKNCIKSEMRFLWNLQQMGKVIRPFCWHQNFVPRGCLPLPLGYIHVLNHEKKMYKIRLQRFFFETCNKWPVTRCSCWQKFCLLWVVSPCPGVIYMYKIMKKIV